MNITAIIVVKERPPHFFKAFDSIEDLASEIIIGTIDIDGEYKQKLLKKNKVKVIELPRDTPFADTVKEDLKKKAKGEYILYLDPDEIFPYQTKKIISEHLKEFDYYLFPRKNIIFGKWIAHSRWWPDYQLRLFKKDSVIWPKALHSLPKAKGAGYTFPNEEQYALLHYNYDSIDQYMEKATRYAKSEAYELVKNGKKYTLSEAMRRGLSEFISRFFAHEGYKDGLHGFALGILQMFYYFLVYFYYWERKKYFDEEQKALVNHAQSFFRQGLKEVNFWLIRKNLLGVAQKIKLKILNKLL